VLYLGSSVLGTECDDDDKGIREEVLREFPGIQLGVKSTDEFATCSCGMELRIFSIYFSRAYTRPFVYSLP
jgi:hypothetical protein